MERRSLTACRSLGGGGLTGFLSITAILFVALIPFFGLRNLSLAMGEGRLYAMIFEPALGGRRRAPQWRGVAIRIVFPPLRPAGRLYLSERLG